MKRVVLLVSFFLLTALSFNQESEQKKAQEIEIKGLIKIERGGSDPQYKDWDRFEAKAIIPSQSLAPTTKKPVKKRTKSPTFATHKGRSSKSTPRRPQTSSDRHQEAKTGSQPAIASAQSLQSKSSTSVRGAESRATTSVDTKANAPKEEKRMIGVETISIIALVLGIIGLALILGFPFSMGRRSEPLSNNQSTDGRPYWDSNNATLTVTKAFEFDEAATTRRITMTITRDGAYVNRDEKKPDAPPRKSSYQPPASTSQGHSRRPSYFGDSGGRRPSRQNQRPAGESSAETSSQSQEGSKAQG